MRKIEKIVVEKVTDNNADLDYLGTYSNAPCGEFAIDRKERGDMQRHEFRYFNPQPGACETQEQADADYKRMEDYERGRWYCVGIIAKASISTSDDGAVWLHNTISSGGLWGIESDTDKSHLDEIAAEQLEELRDVLSDLGFTAEEIAAARVEHSEKF